VSTRSKRRRADTLPTARKRAYAYATTTDDEDEEPEAGEGHNGDLDEPGEMDVDTANDQLSALEVETDHQEGGDGDDDELSPSSECEDDSS
jgi:hypothetical protein